MALGRTGAGTVEGSLLTTAVAVGPDGPAMAALRAMEGWHPVPPGPALWTDDRADVLGALSP